MATIIVSPIAREIARINAALIPERAAGTTDDGNADSFVGWGALNSAGALEAISSFNGIYWGANVLRLPLTADGIETAADITFANSADRLIAVVPASSASRDK